MNVEITVKGITIKVEYTDRNHVDNIILSAIHYENGCKFEEFYEVKNKSEQKSLINEHKKPKNLTPEFFGIKTYDNGKVTYKCSYYCGCGHNGIRYIEGHEEVVYCHRCNDKINVTSSTADALHDDDFNYFTAY